MMRGEIWWADLPPPSGRRPVLLLSREESYSVRDFIIMSPLTTRGRGLRTEVNLGPEDGLSRRSVANLDVIITESKKRLQERIAVLSREKLLAVEDAIRFALGMED
jgi:mRNA interferase MazF